MSRRVRAQDLRPGMMLAEEVVIPGSGRVLGAGLSLDEKEIAAIRTGGVDWVAVEPVTGAPDADHAELADVDRSFRHARGRPAMEALRAAVIRFRRRKGNRDD